MKTRNLLLLTIFQLCFVNIGLSQVINISTISIPDVSMKVNDVVVVTLTTTDDGGFNASAINGTVGGFTLVNLIRNSNTEYTAEFTVLDGGVDVAGGDNIPVVGVYLTNANGDGASYGTPISQINDPIDSNLPAAPSTPDLSAGSDSGTSSTDNITNDNTPTFTGTTEANSTVRIISSLDGSLGTTVADGGGNWSYTPGSAISEGSHTITATATDASGNTSVSSGGLAIQIDVSNPAAPSTPDLSAGSDSGTSNTDNITNDSTPTVTGTAEINSLVTVISNVDGTLGTTTADGAGNWSYTPVVALSAGVHTLTATATDASGNTGVASGGLSITIDLTNPSVQSVSSTAPNGTYKVGDIIPITITFTDNMSVTGTPRLTLETGTIDRDVDFTSVSTNILTFNYTVQTGDVSSDLNYVSTSSLALNSGTIKDIAGNNAALTLPATGSGSSLGGSKAILVDGVVPTVTNVTSTRGNGYAKLGDLVPITITFSENVNVTGTPQLTLETGTIDRVVDFTSVSTNTLTFNYTVQSGDLNSDLSYVATTSLALNGGAIKDAAGNDATLTLPTPGTPGSLSSNKNINVDGDIPLPPTINGLTSGSYNTNQTFTVSGTESDIEYSYNNGGSWSNYSSARTLSTEGTYQVVARQTDLAGNVSSNSTLYTVIIDKTTLTPTLTSPANNSTSSSTGDVTINYTLPEAALGGTVKLTFIYQSGYSVNLADRVVVIKPAYEIPVGSPISFTLDGRDFNAPANSAYVLSATGGTEGICLFSGVLYDVKVEYQDALGNASKSATRTNYFFSAGSPSVDIIDVTPDPRNYNVPSTEGVNVSFSWRVVVTDVQIDHFTLTRDGSNVPLTGVTITPIDVLDGAAKDYKLDLSGVTGVAGTYVLTLSTNGTLGTTIKDRVGNALSAGATDTWVLDLTPPSVVLSDNHPDAVVRNADGIVTITATFTEDNGINVTTPPAINIGSLVTAAPMTPTGDNKVWTYSWSIPTGNYASVPVNVSATDVAGNANTAATGKTSYTIDNLVPNVLSINRVATTPTNLSSVDFIVTFDEPVTNVLNTNFSLSGAAVSATISGIAGTGATRTVSVNTGSTDGTLLLNLTTPAGITDIAGNTLAGPRTCDQSYTVDKTFPELNALTVTSNNVLHPTYVGVGGIVTLTITGSENLVIVNGDVQIEGQNATISGSNKNWTATYTMQSSDITTPVTYKIDFKDLAGNTVTGVTTPSTIIFDKVAPTLTSVSISSSNTPSNTAKVGDVVTILFTADDDIENVVAKINTTKSAVVTDLGGSNWKAEYTMSSADVEGLLTFAITFKDYAGNDCSPKPVVLTSDGTSVTFDKTPPPAPSKPNMEDASDTGTLNSDDITSITTPTFTGTAEINAIIKLYSNIDGLVGTNVPDGTVNWSITASGLTAGNHIITATATDATGNGSLISPALSITIDVAQPAVPSVPGLDPASNSGITSDNITNDNTPTFVGTAEAYSVVTIYSGANLVATTTTNLYGIWTATASTLAEGSNSITAKATDLAGNANLTASPILVIVVDIIAPSTPGAPDLDASSDSGTSSTDDITNYTTPTFTGSTEAGATVKLYSNVNGLLGTGIADGSGNWTITATTLNTGAHSITTTSTDVASNLSGVSAALPITIDIAAPSAPSTPNMEDASDSGASNTDNITNNPTPNISGTSEANAIIKLYSNVDGLIATGVANVSGSWSIPCPLTEGVHSITATATDASGNTSVVSSSLYVTIDLTAPILSSVTVPSANYQLGDTFYVTIQADGKFLTGQTIIVNGKLLALDNLNNNSYRILYTVEAADVNYNTPVGLLPVNIVLRDIAGNANSAILNAAVLGGTNTLTINTKPTYTISGTASRCEGSASLPVTIAFNGVQPFTFTYNINDGTTSVDYPVAPLSANSTIISIPKGTLTLVGLSDATTNSAIIVPTEKAVITENPLPVFEFIDATITTNKLASKIRLINNIKVGGPTGGTFTGICVGADGYFYPSLADFSGSYNDYTITYTFTNSNGCTYTDTFVIRVTGSLAYLQGLSSNKSYCISNTEPTHIITATGMGVISAESFSISDATLGVEWWYNTNPSEPHSIIIDPKLFSTGNHDIIYSYTESGTDLTSKETISIIRVSTTVDFETLLDKYCGNDNVITLVAKNFNYPGGTHHFSSTSPGFTTATNSNSATFSPFLANKGVQITVSYYYQTAQSDGECRSQTIDHFTIVYDVPSVDFTLRSNYNFSEAPVVLSGTPSNVNSYFTGELIEGKSTLNPSRAVGYGATISITYNYTDQSTNCSNSKTLPTLVYRAIDPIRTLLPSENLKSVYCYDDITLDISCTPTIGVTTYPGVFSSSKNAITPLSGNTASYSIKTAGEGVDIVSFSYLIDGTPYRIDKEVFIDSIGDVSIEADNLSILSNNNFCKNGSNVTILGIHRPIDGVNNYLYTGNYNAFSFLNGITATFIPQNEIVGTKNITYSFTSSKGCSKSVTQAVTVRPIPDVSFTVAKECSDGVGDPIGFINTTLAQGSNITSWFWNWGDSKTSTEQNPLSHTYDLVGTKSVVLKADTDYGCSVEKTLSVNIGVAPIANFYWKNDCQTGLPISFRDTSINGPYDAWKWSVNGVEKSTIRHPKLDLPDLGKYEVELVARTTEGCADTVKKEIIIQPYIKLSDINFSYSEDFESNALSWYPKNNLSTSWTYGTPTGTIINDAISGNKAWYTNINLSNQKIENSNIVSPCFNLVGLKKPMIRLKIWSAPEPGRDGAVLQYSIDTAKTWKNLGDKNEGISWYSLGNIGSKPANQSTGWSSDPMMTEWVNARHDLNDLIGQENVRFRVVYATDANALKEFNGFAFDDVWIGERQQSVLDEYFTNSMITSSLAANNYIRSFEKNKKEDIISIHYHIGTPAGDELYNDYTAGPSARMFYYGVNEVPTVFSNGTMPSDLLNTDSKLEFERRVDIETLKDPKIKFDTLYAKNGDAVMKLRALKDLSGENLILFCALVKDSIEVDGTYYYNVLRRFIPNPGGSLLSTSGWLNGQVLDYSIALNVDNPAEYINAKLVAFVQNSNTNEIYQVASYQTSALTSDRPIDLSNLVDIYPNPAKDYLTIECEHSIERLMIFDISGRIVGSYTPAQSRYSLPVQDLKNGLYILKGTTKKGEFIRKFVKQ